MTKYIRFLSILALLVAFLVCPVDAFANGRELANHRISELDSLAVASVDPAADYTVVLDATDGKVKKVLANGLIGIGGITSSAGELNYNDITTLGTAQASKTLTADTNIDVTGVRNWTQTGTFTGGASSDIAINTNKFTVAASTGNTVLGGTLTLGSGGNIAVNTNKFTVAASSGNTLVAGTFDATGATNLASTLGVTGTSTLGAITTTGVLTVDGVVVNKKQLSLPGRVDITICGDGTTINNNTVYYGPSMVPVAGAGRTCDITQVGNATEATADAPALDNTAIQVLSMDCLTADPGAAGVSFTLRNNAGATVPSVTCSAANTKLGCTANVQTTTAIAAGNPISIAAASTGNQGATPFVCTIHAAY